MVNRIAVFSLILVVELLMVNALFTVNVQAAPIPWCIETVDSAGSVGTYSSIALDSADYPHISYYNATNNDLKYARWTGSAWSIQTVDSAGNKLFSSIAVDSGGKPHISYYDMSGKLKYARWTGSAWSIQIVDSTGGAYPSIALDSADYPHISYCDISNVDLKYARWTGSAWSIQIVDSAGDVGTYSSIALDSAGYPHISYYDSTNQDLKYARWTGSFWNTQTVDSAGTVGVYGTSIAVDSGNNPHISYFVGYDQDLKYARWTGSAWSIQTVDSAGSVGMYSSIALDSAGYPHISYDDRSNYNLKCAWWTGSAWSIQAVAFTGFVEAYGSSIAVDSGNKPHISYYDATNQDLKYALGDWTAPTTSHNYDGLWHNTDFTIGLTASDDSGRVNNTYYKVNGGATKTITADGQPSITTENASNTLEYWSTDVAGNQETHTTLTGIKLDKTAPSGSIKINNDDASTITTSVTLNLTASDTTSGVSQMRFSNNGTTYSEWQAYTTPMPWNLEAGDGTKTVYVQFKDTAGLISTYSDIITLASPPGQLTASATPASASVTVGQSVAFTVTPSGGTPPYTYQWYEGTSLLSGQTSAQLTTSKSAAGTYTFYCKVTDSGGGTANSNTVTLTVTSTPPTVPELTVSATPASASVTVGQSATFTATPSGGASPYTYQWYEGTSLLAGKTYATLSTFKSTAGTYTFTCKVTDSRGQAATSNPVTLTVTSVPELTVSATSTSASVAVGQSATLTATPSEGTPPYTYQWYEGTSLIAGETSATLTITETAAGTYTYYCKVTDSEGSTANSNNVTLRVTSQQAPPPSLAFPPEGYIIIAVVVAVAVALIIYKLLKRPRKPPSPAQLRITAEPASIVADGETKSVITMQLLDKKGNPIAAIADTQVKITATKGKLATPIVTIPKGKDTEKTVIVSSTETGPAPVSANAEGLKSITITLNFLEKKRYCMHCGALFPTKAKTCQNCGKVPPAGVDTKVCQNCKSVIPVVAKYCSECGAGQKE